MKAPTMKTSPWAKLIRRTIPYTIVYPRAIRAYTNPSCRPFSACWRKYSTVAPLWVHHLNELLPAPLDLHDRRALDAVSVPVKRGFSGDPVEIPDRGKGIPDLPRVVAPRLPDRLEEQFRAVIRQRPEGVGNLPVLLLVLLYPRHDLRPPVVRRVVVGEVAALDRAPGDLHQVGGVPPVRSDQLNLQPLLLRLLGDQADLVVVVRQEHHVRPGSLYLCEQRGEVHVVLPVCFEGRRRPAQFPEAVAEHFGGPFRVVVRRVEQDRGAFFLQRLAREFGHHHPLEGVDEAAPEHVVLPLPVRHGDLRVRGRRGERGDFRGLYDIRDGDRRLGSDRTDDRLDPMLVHQEVRHVRRLRGVVLVVLDDVRDLHPRDAALRVRLLDGDQEGVPDRFAVRFDVTGERRDEADHDLFRVGGDDRHQGREKNGEDKPTALHRASFPHVEGGGGAPTHHST